MNSELRNARDVIHKPLLTDESQQAEAWYGIRCQVLEVKNNENMRELIKDGQQGGVVQEQTHH